MVTEHGNYLMEFDFVMAIEDFRKLIIQIDLLTIFLILESIRFNILPKSANDLNSSFFLNTKNCLQMRAQLESLRILFQIHLHFNIDQIM